MRRCSCHRRAGTWRDKLSDCNSQKIGSGPPWLPSRILDSSVCFVDPDSQISVRRPEGGVPASEGPAMGRRRSPRLVARRAGRPFFSSVSRFFFFSLLLSSGSVALVAAASKFFAPPRAVREPSPRCRCSCPAGLSPLDPDFALKKSGSILHLARRCMVDCSSGIVSHRRAGASPGVSVETGR